jgi:hypothetical protein
MWVLAILLATLASGVAPVPVCFPDATGPPPAGEGPIEGASFRDRHSNASPTFGQCRGCDGPGRDTAAGATVPGTLSA